jgi:hypothetical protein
MSQKGNQTKAIDAMGNKKRSENMKKNMNNNTKKSNENIKDNAIADQSQERESVQIRTSFGRCFGFNVLNSNTPIITRSIKYEVGNYMGALCEVYEIDLLD